MPNPNFIILLFFLWMLLGKPTQTLCLWLDIQKAKGGYSTDQIWKIKTVDLWIYMVTGGALLILGVLVWLF